MRWRFNRETTIATIAPAFDANWYLSRNPDVKAAGVDPVTHYVEFGYLERRDPHPLFDTGWYLSRYPDSGGGGLNPLVHYLLIGARSGYDPHPLFDSAWYAAQNVDVRRANPLLHFIRHGGPQELDPHPRFHSKAYAAAHPGDEHPGTTAIVRLVTEAADAGWRVTAVDRRFAPLLALRVRHKDGREAAWLFDRNMRRMAEVIESWPPDAIAALDSQTQIARSIWQSLVCATYPGIDALSRDACEDGVLFRSGNETLLHGLRRWRDQIGLTSHEIEIGQGDTTLYECGDLTVRADLARELLTADESASPHVAAALMSGALSCRSPVDGRELRSDASLLLTPQLIAYRFVDAAHEAVFYVISPILGWAQARAVYFPRQQVRFISPGWKDPVFEKLYGNSIELMIARHALSHALDIESYLLSPGDRALALVFAQANIAHHLWNELGELDRLTNAGLPAPEVILVDGGKLEHFGPIDVLFPESQGRVQRKIPTAQLASYIYRNGLCAFGPTSKFVSQRLRDRILQFSTSPKEFENCAPVCDGIAQQHGPIIVIGLRAHNRTLVDFAGVCVAITEFILQEFGRVTVIFDGWSANGSPDFIRAEKEIVAQFRRSVRHLGVDVVDMVGRPMAESLNWITQADFFVSVYGAGMAKYRWICNKPGLLLTGRWNLEHRSDLRIYDSEAYMEAPAPMLLVNSDDVEDEPGAALLRDDVLHPAKSQMNFRVNRDALTRYLRQLLTRHVVPRWLGTSPQAAAEHVGDERD